MRSTIDRAGRIVIPRALREAASLEAGTEVDIQVVDGKVEIEPATARVKLVRRGGLLVAVPDHPLPTLTADIVERTRQAVRRRRSR